MHIDRRQFCASAAAATASAFLTPGNAWTAIAGRRVARNFDPWLEIDAAALAHNVRAAARLAGGRPVIAVVKNNAYGLGLDVAGPLLDALAEVRMLAVVRPEEARRLRRAGTRKPILLMGPAAEEELMELLPSGVIPAPHDLASAAILARAARRLGRVVPAQLYVDTGMHRMGVPVAQALATAQSLAGTRAVRLDGAFTELVEDADFDREQAGRLRELAGAARAAGIEIGLLHAASTDAIQHGTADAFLDAVRPGLALYGGYVSERARAAAEFQPAYSLKARIIRVDHLEAGEGVSYHRRWKAERPVWAATLAVGHVDGYPAGAVRGCEVLVRGRLCPVVGTVSASHTIVVLGEDQFASVGDEATLVGGEHPTLHPNEVARRSGYSEYNMFMHLSPTLNRVVRGR